MKVHQLIDSLKDCNPSSEVNIYFTPPGYIDADGNTTEYILAEPVVVVDNGWNGLVTIEVGEIVGS